MINGNILWACILTLFIQYAEYESKSTEDRSHSKPHIVLILADDLGFDDVSFRGSNEFITPNIDALGYHGIILDRFYAPALGTPSRAALLTGLYPLHTGTQYKSLENGAIGALPKNLTLLSTIFQNAGYSTNLIGKWNLGYARKEDTPIFRGYHYHFGYWGNYIDHYQRRAKASPSCNHSIGYDFRRNLNVECTNLGTYVSELFTNEAERIILEHKNENGKPLFLVIAHALPHHPLQAPQEYLRKFSYIKDRERRTYAAMVSILDHSVGRILRSLERANMLENSIIVFSSDNGAASVGVAKNSGSNWPFRGQKDSPWEGGIRLPAAIWSPLLNPAARQRIFRQTTYIGDWLPTLAAAAGISITASQLESLDGLNLWSILMDMSNTEKNSVQKRDLLHSFDPKRYFVSYLNGPWKYINGTTYNGLYDTVLTYRELYDIDPRAERYVIEVRNSMASKALSKFDEQRLTQHRIESLRRAASVQCGSQQRGCNALLEECLFNIETDPCEQNNLIYDARYLATLNELRATVRQFAERPVFPIENSCTNIMKSDPSLHNCAWSTFLDEPINSVPLVCGIEGPPCEEV